MRYSLTVIIGYRDRYVEAGGLIFHYLDWGSPSNPTLVLCHGFRDTAHTWDELAERLAVERRIIAIDSRNHGESDSAPPPLDSSILPEDLRAFVDAIGLDQFDLLGHSMGGRQAMGYADGNPNRVRRLIIEDVGPSYPKTSQLPPAIAAAVPQSVSGLDEVMAFTYNKRRDDAYNRTKALLARWPSQDGRMIPKFNAVLPDRNTHPPPDHWPALQRIGCPTLVVRGAHSKVLDEPTLQKMVRALPDGRSVTIPNAGHRVHEDNTYDFAAVLTEFLDQPGGNG